MKHQVYEVSAHETSLNSLFFFIEVPVPSQESEIVLDYGIVLTV
jgi:hypothetical protein